jgi:hypothetical protein
MLNAIKSGYGIGHHAKEEGATRNNVKGKRDNLVTGGCQIIATIGGLFVNTGISGTTVPFVSLVGSIPTSPDPNCYGGVSLETVNSNKARRDLLTAKGIANIANICLYRVDANTGAPPLELTEWTSSGASYKNYMGNFDNDLNQAGGVPAATEGLVISASPVFETNMNGLVAAAKTWLSNPPMGKIRYIVYPLTIYEKASPPPTNVPGKGKNILFGPDLIPACGFLGLYASQAAGGVKPGWLQVPNIQIDVPDPA